MRQRGEEGHQQASGGESENNFRRQGCRRTLEKELTLEGALIELFCALSMLLLDQDKPSSKNFLASSHAMLSRRVGTGAILGPDIF